MDNLWTRRTNSSKLSLSTGNNSGANGSAPLGDSSLRSASFSKRSATTPGGGLASPTGGASNAFGLGSGAFASFSMGSAKTPKTPGNPFDLAMGSIGAKPQGGGGDRSAKESIAPTSKTITKPPSMASISETKSAEQLSPEPSHPLKNQWVFWFRPPISKGFVDYEKTVHAMARCHSVEEFFDIYTHLKRPSMLPLMSDYHFFKFGIRPIWEDDVNKKGGKWVVRLKKGVADRYWEDLLYALIGDQFSDAAEEVCGAVVSVRNGEDIISIWTRTDGGRVLRIRETMRHVLNFPPNTRVEFKSHDSSIQQRSAMEESRREKGVSHHHHPRGPRAGSDDQKQQHSSAIS